MSRALILTLLLTVVAACGGGDDASDPSGYGEVEGGQVYLDHCQYCHGYDGGGTTAGPALVPYARALSQDDVIDTVLLGSGDMDPTPVDGADAETVAAFVLDTLQEG